MTMKSAAKEITAYMESLHNEEQREILMRFFKTAPGEYGYGDEFLGIKVPQTRKVVGLVARDFPLSEVPASSVSLSVMPPRDYLKMPMPYVVATKY